MAATNPQHHNIIYHRDPRIVQDLTLQEVHAAVEVALKGPVPRRKRGAWLKPGRLVVRSRGNWRIFVFCMYPWFLGVNDQTR